MCRGPPPPACLVSPCTAAPPGPEEGRNIPAVAAAGCAGAARRPRRPILRPQRSHRPPHGRPKTADGLGAAGASGTSAGTAITLSRTPALYKQVGASGVFRDPNSLHTPRSRRRAAFGLPWHPAAVRGADQQERSLGRARGSRRIGLRRAPLALSPPSRAPLRSSACSLCGAGCPLPRTRRECRRPPSTQGASRARRRCGACAVLQDLSSRSSLRI